MDRHGEQGSDHATALRAGDEVLIVTAGRVDARDAAQAMRLLERLGVSCTLLDVSSSGSSPAMLTASVRDAFAEIGSCASGRGRAGLAAAGSGAGPALAAAAALTAGSSLPGVLIVNGRFDRAWRPFSVLDAPALLMLDRDRPWRERRTQRQVRGELGAGSELVVLRSISRGGEDALHAWSRGVSAQPQRSAGSRPAGRKVAMAGLAGVAVALVPAVAAAPALADLLAGGKTVASSSIAGDGLGGAALAPGAGATPAASKEGRKVSSGHVHGDGLHTRSTGGISLLGGGFKFFVNTNITFNTTSSASGGMSEASATASLNASTTAGGTQLMAINDAFDGYNSLAVHVGAGAPAGPPATGNSDYVFYNRNGTAPTSDCSGQELLFPDQVSGDLTMSRRVYVTPSQPVARWLNVFKNTGTAPLDVTMYTANNLGSDNNTKIFATSSGDTTADLADSWVGSFQNFSGSTSSDPREGHVLRGTNVPNGVTSLHFVDGDDNPYWTYALTIAPGQTKIVANYVTLAETQALAASRATAIAASPPLDCVTPADQAEITNFDRVAPVITPPPAPAPVVAPTPAGAPVTFPTPAATDNVDPTVPVTCTPPSGSIFPVGTTVVTCTATDASGNVSTTTFNVVVKPPVVPTPPPPPPPVAPPVPPPVPPRPPLPTSTVAHVKTSPQPITLHGVATGYKLFKLRVSVAQKKGTLCRYLEAGGRFSATRSCKRTSYLDATGTTAWSFKLPRLSSGTYLVWSRAIDGLGRVELKSKPRNFEKFTIPKH